MAELLNRQVLINLHSTSGTTDAFKAKAVEGEFGILNPTVEGAKIFTKTADGNVAVFVTENAVDAKVKVVNDALTAHTTAYATKVAELESADSDLSDRIDGVADDVKDLQDLMGSGIAGKTFGERLTEVETLAADNAQAIADETSARDSADTALGLRIDGVEASASTNAQAITDETTARENADKALGTRIDNEKSARESADTALGVRIDNVETAATALTNRVTTAETKITTLEANMGTLESELTSADTQIRADFAAADAALKGTTGDTSANTTIYGAIAYAKKAEGDAAAAQAAADSAQDSADEANEWIANFMRAENLGEEAIDTLKEIQNYIDSDKQGAAAMSAEIAKKVAQTEYDAYVTANDKAVASNAAAIGTNAQAIADEETARENADKALGTRIDNEKSARESADTALGVRIDNVETAATALTNRVTSAETKITTLEAKVGTLETDFVKEAQIINAGGNTITASKSDNKLTFDFANLVIDCGTF